MSEHTIKTNIFRSFFHIIELFLFRYITASSNRRVRSYSNILLNDTNLRPWPWGQRKKNEIFYSLSFFLDPLSTIPLPSAVAYVYHTLPTIDHLGEALQILILQQQSVMSIWFLAGCTSQWDEMLQKVYLSFFHKTIFFFIWVYMNMTVLQLFSRFLLDTVVHKIGNFDLIETILPQSVYVDTVQCSSGRFFSHINRIYTWFFVQIHRTRCKKNVDQMIYVPSQPT